jgi:hypothetical protein
MMPMKGGGMDEVIYGTVRDIVFVRGFQSLNQRQLDDDERERIARLAERLHRRLQAVIRRLNRDRDPSRMLYCEPGFEPIFDDGFRHELRDVGGFSGSTDFSAIRCNFDLTGFLVAYVWRLSRLVPDMIWHFNHERYFCRGRALVRHSDQFAIDHEGRLPERLRRFVQPRKSRPPRRDP